MINFDNFIYKIDRWRGEMEFSRKSSNTKKLRISMVGPSGSITQEQKTAILEFIGNYDELWIEIAKELDISHNQKLDTTISLASPGVVSGTNGLQTYDYIIGYKAFSDEEYIHSYMVCIDNMKVMEIIQAI